MTTEFTYSGQMSILGNILLIEDDLEIQQAVTAFFSDEYKIISALSLKDAQKVLGQLEYVVILVDLGLPDGEGFEICKIIRERVNTRTVPILFMTAQGGVENKIKAFSLGADDYLVKPVDFLELKARLSRHVQRSKANHEKHGTGEQIEIGNLVLNTVKQTVAVYDSELHESEVEVTRTEFKLLLHFVTAPNQIFSREVLRKLIWRNNQCADRTVDMHISNLNKKLKKNGSRVGIKSVQGVGYGLS